MNFVHGAVDDADATMKIAEAMCAESGLTLPQLLDKYGVTLGKIENYEIEQTTSTLHREHQANLIKRREEREQKRAELHRFIDKERRRRDRNGELKNKRFCFSHRFEEETEKAKELILLAFTKGCFYSYRAEECDYYVAYEGESGARLKTVLDRAGTRVFTPEQFSEFLLSQK